MSLKTIAQVSIGAELSSSLDHVLARAPIGIKKTLTLSSGTGANQADRVFVDTRTLAASASEDLDLAGSLTDALGGPFVLARLKLLYVYAFAANTNNVIVGAGTNGIAAPFAAATNALNVRPGGFILLGAVDATAYAVAAGTADILKLANSSSGTPVTYDIIAVGCSA